MGAATGEHGWEKHTGSAGPGRDKSRVGTMRVTSRQMLADVLTRGGLGHMFRETMASGVSRFHEHASRDLERQKSKESEKEADALAQYAQVKGRMREEKS